VESAIVRASQRVLGNAVVSVRRNPDFLVGHVEFVPSASEHDSPQEQTRFLELLVSRLPLPKYMCPAVLVPLDRIPVNAHGKTVRLAAQALPLSSLARSDQSESHITGTEKVLLDIWTQVLPIDLTVAVSIRPEADFFSLGDGSYLLVQVQRLIRQHFHVSIPVRELFGVGNLREMASSVDAATMASAIDWQIETALDGISSNETSSRLTTLVKTSGMTVVLTGATGYLGRNILKALSEDPAVSTIHCVAIRDETRVPRFETKSVSTAAQIVVHTGDQGAPLLGLSTADFDMLASEADVLIHSGTDRSFWDSYQTLRGANLVSTKTMIQMSARRCLPLHFISSGGLVPRTAHGLGTAAAASVTGLATPLADGSNGYLASKWASEVSLERAGHDLGLPVHIHRITCAEGGMPETLTGQLHAEFRDIATKLKAIPQARSWRSSFDVSRTSTLCGTLVKNFVRPSRDATGGEEEDHVRYFHYPSEIHLDIDAVPEVFDGIKGVEMLPPHVWVGKAKTEGIDWYFSGQDFEATMAEGLSLKR
jgi:hybrid polyketide synthase/nonribosomal peptide synthetase ACE1